jgi:hypothetical protein
MGPGLIGLGLILAIVGITTPITDVLDPFGKFWWPDGPRSSRRGQRAVRTISAVFTGGGIVIVILGIVLAARS